MKTSANALLFFFFNSVTPLSSCPAVSVNTLLHDTTLGQSPSLASTIWEHLFYDVILCLCVTAESLWK